MTFSLLEICAAGGDTLLQTRAPIFGKNMQGITCLKPTSFPTLSVTTISKITKNWKLECCRGRAGEYFPLFHVFLLPNIVKVLATNTS